MIPLVTTGYRKILKILLQNSIIHENLDCGPGSFRPGSFRPKIGVGRFGLGRWVDSALGGFGDCLGQADKQIDR